jgi:hypothetical protein
MRLIFATENPYLLKHLCLLFKYTKINYDFIPVVINKCPHSLYHSINQSKAVIVFFRELEQSYALVRTRYSLASLQCIVPMDLRRQKRATGNLAPGTVFTFGQRERDVDLDAPERVNCAVIPNRIDSDTENEHGHFDINAEHGGSNVHESRVPVTAQCTVGAGSLFGGFQRCCNSDRFTSFFGSGVAVDRFECKPGVSGDADLGVLPNLGDEDERFTYLYTMKDVLTSFFASMVEWSLTPNSVEFLVVPVRADNVREIHDAYVECFGTLLI